MTNVSPEHEDLPPLYLSVEMDEVIHEMAAEAGKDVEQIKLNARRILKYLPEQGQVSPESF
jgi:hypothetical protein